jgi:4-alpha-glucanotransferase
MADWYDGLSVQERTSLLELPELHALDPKQPFDATVRDALLRVLYRAPSTLALIQFPDAMGARERINIPGTVNDTNWTYRVDKTVEQLAEETEHTERLARLARDAQRAP